MSSCPQERKPGSRRTIDFNGNVPTGISKQGLNGSELNSSGMHEAISDILRLQPGSHNPTAELMIKYLNHGTDDGLSLDFGGIGSRLRAQEEMQQQELDSLNAEAEEVSRQLKSQRATLLQLNMQKEQATKAYKQAAKQCDAKVSELKKEYTIAKAENKKLLADVKGRKHVIKMYKRFERAFVPEEHRMSETSAGVSSEATACESVGG